MVYSLATMSELYIPQPSQIVHLQEQPHFPVEDLSENNKQILVHTLPRESGVEAVAETLSHHQQYLYLVAMRGLEKIGYDSPDYLSGLTAFTSGFAAFETISNLVHKPRLYNGNYATFRVATSLIDVKPAEPEPRDDFEAELYHLIEDETEQNTNGEVPVEFENVELPEELRDFVSRTNHQHSKLGERDHFAVDEFFASRHHIIPEEMPNTFEVLLSAAVAHSETQKQIQARLAGASLALALQTTD